MQDRHCGNVPRRTAVSLVSTMRRRGPARPRLGAVIGAERTNGLEHCMRDDLDGVIVAPDNHKVLFENDAVRVLETTVASGELTPLHTHLAATVMYVVSGSHFVRRDEHGAAMVDTRENPAFVLPKVLYAESTPKHTIENTGRDDLVVIGVELKQQGSR
jgi:mannose-6-phosphate isomerase-like protein (cupin superfamily)